MSAATMLACSADEIIMGKQSSLGPIDPQIILQSQYGVRMQSAQAIIDNFERVRKVAIESPGELGAHLPILNQYFPGLVDQCYNAQSLSVGLVSSWLQSYMLKSTQKSKQLSEEIARKLADHMYFKSHSRHIDKEQLCKMGLKVSSLEDDQKLQDLVLSVFHATTLAFQLGTVKIIENHLGNVFITQPTSRPQPTQAR